MDGVTHTNFCPYTDMLNIIMTNDSNDPGTASLRKWFRRAGGLHLVQAGLLRQAEYVGYVIPELEIKGIEVIKDGQRYSPSHAIGKKKIAATLQAILGRSCQCMSCIDFRRQPQQMTMTFPQQSSLIDQQMYLSWLWLQQQQQQLQQQWVAYHHQQHFQPHAQGTFQQQPPQQVTHNNDNNIGSAPGNGITICPICQDNDPTKPLDSTLRCCNRKVHQSCVNDLKDKCSSNHVIQHATCPCCRDELFVDLIKMNTVLKSLKDHEYGWLLAEPVDPIELGLPDYFDVIKNPMDFSTIQMRLDDGKFYSSVDEFQSDVLLTFANAMKYNAASPVIPGMVKELKEYFEGKMKEVLG